MNSKKLKTDVMDHEAGKEYVCAENTKMVSGQRLEWTVVRTGENTHGAIDFNKIKNQYEHPFKGSEQ